jgi:hypothetical protein
VGREIRRVPPGWNHPRGEWGKFLPLTDRDYVEVAEEWLRNCILWSKGEHPNQLASPEIYNEYAYYWEAEGGPPDPESFRPRWTEEEATHYGHDLYPGQGGNLCVGEKSERRPLPEVENVQSGIVISVEDQATGRTIVKTISQGLLHGCPAATAPLTRSPGADSDHWVASFFRFATQVQSESRPRALHDPAAKAAGRRRAQSCRLSIRRGHLLDVEVFNRKAVELREQDSNDLTEEIRSSMSNLEVKLSEIPPRFSSSSTPSLLSREHLLCFLELLERSTQKAGMRNRLSGRESRKSCQSDIDADRLLRRSDFGSRTDIDEEISPPSSSTEEESKSPDLPLSVNRVPHPKTQGDFTYIEDEGLALNRPALFLEDERREAISSFEPRITRLLSRLDSSEERLESGIKSVKNRQTSHHYRKISIDGIFGSQQSQLLLLIVQGEGPSSLPVDLSLLETGVVKPSELIEDLSKTSFGFEGATEFDSRGADHEEESNSSRGKTPIEGISDQPSMDLTGVKIMPTHYQVYETVSEGTPVSPVFATEEEIVLWCLSQGHSEKAARSFVEAKWVPSGSFNSRTGHFLTHIDILDGE